MEKYVLHNHIYYPVITVHFYYTPLYIYLHSYAFLQTYTNSFYIYMYLKYILLR